MLQQIKERYNCENDVRPEGPPVTWAEMDLYEALMKLTARVESLERMRANVVDTLSVHVPGDDLAQKIWFAVSE
jgi:hypothetical protein